MFHYLVLSPDPELVYHTAVKVAHPEVCDWAVVNGYKTCPTPLIHL